MKKAFDKFMVVVILLAVIGGVTLYFYNMNSFDEPSFDDEEIESMYLCDIPIYNQKFYHADIENGQVLDLMDRSDASYFNICLYNDEPGRTTYELSQINKSEYDAFQAQSLYESSDLRFMKLVEESLLDFFNYTYEDTTSNYSSDLYHSYIFESVFGEIAPNTESVIDSYFDDNIDSVFIDNQIVLSCEDIAFTKICNTVFDEDYTKDQYHDQNDRYFCIGDCKVTVKSIHGEETIDTKVKVAGKIEKTGDFTAPYGIFLSNIMFE